MPPVVVISAERVLWASSVAVLEASSASLEPSVARRILVGKMLIGDVSSPRTFSFNGSCYLEKPRASPKRVVCPPAATNF
jgi:hypothetical protein